MESEDFCSADEDLSDQTIDKDSTDENDTINIGFIALEDLDPVVVALQREIQSGNLPRDHIFYKMLANALEFAQKSGDPQTQFSHSKDVTLFTETLAFHGKDRVMNLLCGPGFKGQQKGGKYTFHWNDWNLPFVPSKSTRNKEKAGYATKSVSFATDGIAIKPGLQFDTRVKNLVGLLFPVDLDYVKMNPSPKPEGLKTEFVTEVNCENVTSLDNRLSLPVALEYSGKRVSGDDKVDTINKRVKQLQIYLRCLMQDITTEMNVIATLGESCTSHCSECLECQSVCPTCYEKGHKFIDSVLRACDRCLESGSKCVKLLVLVWTAD
ncbi:Hypothetical predicted protein [Paramuricea clavata]|uniref:Uncharacterized protein n=1 Tax=Paramuricea clavata TaxID=317549 RepID=A0A6S7GGL9_PARCT|nr:Hypothetical predicted protein [Paramuricea clavata]